MEVYMQTKQYYASVELAEDEVRFVVGEFFMSRFNVLRVERITTSGIKNKIIVDKENVVTAIVKASQSIEKNLGIKLKSVILCIPSVDVKCVRKRINIPIEDGSKKIQLKHAQSGLIKAIGAFHMEGYEFVNLSSVKYINGGITSRSIPLDEIADSLIMDVDFICADQSSVYSYVTCIESAGLKVRDIVLDNYAIAEESTILENSMEHYIVLINYDKDSTALSLFYKGRLLACEVLKMGYNRIIDTIRRKYRISYREAFNLFKESSLYSKNDLNQSLIYIYASEGEYKQISRKDIFDTISKELSAWIEDVNHANSLIVEKGNAKMVISGAGSDIVGLSTICDFFSLETKIYIPSTLGARKGCYSAVLGAIYSHRKWQELLPSDDIVVEEKIEEKNVKKEDEHTFTRKLRNILLNK